MLVFIIEVLGSPEGEQVSSCHWMQHAPARTLQQGLAGAMSGQDGKARADREGLGSVLRRVGQDAGRPPSHALDSGLCRPPVSQHADKQDLEKTVTWAKQEMNRGKYPDLAADLYACARLQQGREQKAQQSPSAGRRRCAKPVGLPRTISAS